MSDSNPVEIAILREAERIADIPFDDGPFWQFNPKYLVREQFIRDKVIELRDKFQDVIAALEREGFKLMRREPTKEMAKAGEQAVDDAIDESTDSYQTYVIKDPDKWAAVGFQAMFDTAPSLLHQA